MSNGETGEGKLLTPDEARKRVLDGTQKAGALDLTPPLKKPLTEADTVATQSVVKGRTTAEVAVGQLLDDQRESGGPAPAETSKPAESPAQKITRLSKGETR